MPYAVQPWHPQDGYKPPTEEIVVEEIFDDEDGKYSAVEKDENHTGQGAAFVDPLSDTRTRSSYTETNTRYTDGRQEHQQAPSYSRPRVHITRKSYGSYTEAIPQQTSPCPRLHIRRTSHGSYREAVPQRASPRSSLAYTAPINHPETPMRYFDVGGRQYPYYFHNYEDAGIGFWRLDPPYRSSDTTGMSRSETLHPRTRDIPYRRAEGASDFGRYLDDSELRVVEWREDVASQTARQSDARNREEAHHSRRDRNQ
ncbi:6d05df74-a054-4227-9814-924e12de5de6 [Sclerotinia trifoliorum]|uniref:6d05df74-a054-4227-9814-924e12de5de6 n=1 Tax=Sclerotinia trifoliorum TaxID=28548 RepID=A0A8H2W3F3_9HELO|nr:6d05df74-a054-4227-9814-924e12de5de6 [Sclerotinia trifoliorum]